MPGYFFCKNDAFLLAGEVALCFPMMETLIALRTFSCLIISIDNGVPSYQQQVFWGAIFAKPLPIFTISGIFL